MATQQKQWPTWIIVISVIILAPILIVVLRISLGWLSAIGIVGVLVIAAFVGLFIWVKRRVDAER